MACHGGPDIVEDNLVLCLDAANTKSYPGSGNDWYDISGNGINGTLDDNTFDNGNGGNIVFDASQGAKVVTDDTGLNVAGPASMSIWYMQVGSESDNVVMTINKTSSSDGLRIGLKNDTLTTSNYGATYNGSWTSTPSTNVWTNLVVTFHDSTIKGYINTVLKYNTTSFNNDTASDAVIILGTRATNAADWFADMKVSQFYLYNRILTESEIKQNYNVVKSRFGT